MMTVNLQMNSNEGKNLVNMEIIHTVDMHRKDMRFTFIIHSYIPSKICIIYIYIYMPRWQEMRFILEIDFLNKFQRYFFLIEIQTTNNS